MAELNRKGDTVFFITESIHNMIDDIYEAIMDNEDSEALNSIEDALQQLRDLKNNLTIKNEI